MLGEIWHAAKAPKPVCIGAGLVALDVVVNGDPMAVPRISAGGSCGNVLAILAYFGWASYPLAHLRQNAAAKELVIDLQKWSVRTGFIHQNGMGSTPVFIEKIAKSRGGQPIHTFTRICPKCGTELPRYRPVPLREVQDIAQQLPRAQVFYFDRVAPSSLDLARNAKKKGSLVVFEPSGIKDEKLFLESVRIADVVKYSHERLSRAKEITQLVNIPLEIETLGADGLNYRTGNQPWRLMPAFPVQHLQDAAGSGDWCSAGLIHFLGRRGYIDVTKVSVEEIERGLKFGQLLAALNCQFEGARGVMYNLSKHKFRRLVKHVWLNAELPELEETINPVRSQRLEKGVCSYCGSNARR